jgi:thiol-disulfide isomerase/thioredoxin
MSAYSRAFHRLLEEETLSEAVETLLRNNYQIQRAKFLLDYAMMWGKENQIPLDFFSFLQTISMDDRELLSTKHFSAFIHLFEFLQPFVQAEQQVFDRMRPEITFVQFLFEELNIPKTPEDEVFLTLYKSFTEGDFADTTAPETMELFEKFRSALNAFGERHQEHFGTYRKKFLDVIPQSMEEIMLARWEIRDSVLTHVLNLTPGIVYDISRVRSLKSLLPNMSVNSEEIIASLTGNIPEPFLRQEADRLFTQSLSAAQQMGQELPDTYAATIFRELIAPFRGKVVLVNFWATTCSPCIASIREQKALRERHKNSLDVAFVFITSEDASPLSAYQNFVNEQKLTHSFRISAEQFNHFRQLFRFLGIPHYVLVDRGGRILDSNFNPHTFEQRLQEMWIK